VGGVGVPLYVLLRVGDPLDHLDVRFIDLLEGDRAHSDPLSAHHMRGGLNREQSPFAETMIYEGCPNGPR